VVIVLPPVSTLGVIDDMAALGIRQLWLQQGAESREAEEKALALGMNVVSGECMFMHLPPVESIHGFHRFFRKLFGRMPRESICRSRWNAARRCRSLSTTAAGALLPKSLLSNFSSLSI